MSRSHVWHPEKFPLGIRWNAFSGSLQARVAPAFFFEWSEPWACNMYAYVVTAGGFIMAKGYGTTEQEAKTLATHYLGV